MSVKRSECDRCAGWGCDNCETEQLVVAQPAGERVREIISDYRQSHKLHFDCPDSEEMCQLCAKAEEYLAAQPSPTAQQSEMPEPLVNAAGLDAAADYGSIVNSMRIACVIEAEQFLEGQPIPKGVCFGWRCQSEALKNVPHLHTIHQGQSVIIEFGDWIVPELDGEHYYPIRAEVFEATYELVASASAKEEKGE